MFELDNDIIQFIPYLRRYARALTGDFELAETLVQQSMECVSGLSHLFRDKLNSDKKNRLFSVFHLIYNDYANGQKNLSTWTKNNPQNRYAADNHELDDKFRHDIFYQVFRQLPIQQKQVFLLVTVERFLYEDVSKILNMPLGKMLSLLHTARKSIVEKVYSKSVPQDGPNAKSIHEQKHEAAEISL